MPFQSRPGPGEKFSPGPKPHWEIPLTPGHRLGCMCHSCMAKAKLRRTNKEKFDEDFETNQIMELFACGPG